ncbi:MAG: hypothetical protein A2Y13_02260 [Planctomycetes bacterium GWC2_45_44]|uniref:Major facilitator superfamily n=1 Tax=candidate division CPR1 bacterium GW2011_GWA2_42_17 TaxID=1618341 RepID=A0A0G0Z7K8_9BACT|nr:MAG: Major facilitator superfamily [candidate division CPR1 bacterium GW2011_GWA2_42_17]OHB44043.1 MAG: hypothetical protein A2Y13_02260 [Planctomycetes bacterium GWC2_45_44]
MNNAVDLKAIKPYRAGTLTYTRLGLITLFLWLLWGDFCFTLMRAVIPNLLPLALKDLGASNLLMGVVIGSIPSLMNMIVNPIISVRSDRYRSRFGRRIPFLFIATPFVALFLILIGYSDAIGIWLHSHILYSCNISSISLMIALICIFSVCFQFFNMFISSIYYYLFADVVPEQFMGRFMAWFQVVGTASGFLFYRYILGFSKTHMREIYFVIGLVYLISFLFMCWRVKEGEYPPPPEHAHGKSIIGSVKVYLHECFGHSLYIWIFLGTATFMVAVVSTSAFGLLFARDTLGLSLDEIGKIQSWCMLLSFCLMIPMGYLSDKLHPLRIYIIGVAIFVVGMTVSFFAIHDKSTYFVYSLITTALYLFFAVSNVPMFIALVPREKYGQFSSANAIVNSLGIILGSFLAGKFFDIIGNYRYLYIWVAFFGFLSLIPMFFVYREWSRRGGIKGYVPPHI